MIICDFALHATFIIKIRFPALSKINNLYSLPVADKVYTDGF